MHPPPPLNAKNFQYYGKFHKIHFMFLHFRYSYSPPPLSPDLVISGCGDDQTCQTDDVLCLDQQVQIEKRMLLMPEQAAQVCAGDFGDDYQVGLGFFLSDVFVVFSEVVLRVLYTASKFSKFSFLKILFGVATRTTSTASTFCGIYVDNSLFFSSKKAC